MFACGDSLAFFSFFFLFFFEDRYRGCRVLHILGVCVWASDLQYSYVKIM